MTPEQAKLIQMGSKIRQRLSNSFPNIGRDGVVTAMWSHFFTVTWNDPALRPTTFNRVSTVTTPQLSFTRAKPRNPERAEKS